MDMNRQCTEFRISKNDVEAIIATSVKLLWTPSLDLLTLHDGERVSNKRSKEMMIGGFVNNTTKTTNIILFETYGGLHAKLKCINNNNIIIIC